MNNDALFEILLVLLPTVIGGFLGYFLKYYLDKKKEIQSELYAQKREMYQEFIKIIIDLIKGTKDKKNKDSKKNNDMDKSVKELYEFYKSYLIYSSPKFINAFGDYMQYVYTQEKTTKEHVHKLARVIKSLRQEVGLSNRGLGKDGVRVFRALFKDFNKIGK